MVQWHSSPSVIAALTSSIAPTQSLRLLANTVQLGSDIPVEPRIVDSGFGMVNEWYGHIGMRPIIVQSTVRGDDVPLSVIVSTPFDDPPAAKGEWSILLGLSDLPGSIFWTRPLFIQSRECDKMFCVYRPDPRGWADPIYEAVNKTEADGFLTFLKADSWNEGCFLGPVEQPQKWDVLVNGMWGETRIGCYPQRRVSLEFAWKMSKTEMRGRIVIVTNSRSGAPLEEFEFLDGEITKLNGTRTVENHRFI